MTPLALQVLDVALPAGSGPYAALSLIVAPAILTNASSLLVLSTSNRLARAVDLTTELARTLEHTAAGSANPDTARALGEMESAGARSLLLVRALRAAYGALAGFATTTLVSLVGAVLGERLTPGVRAVLEVASMAGGAFAVGSVVWSAVLLVRETRLAVAMLHTRVRAQEARFAARAARPGAQHL